MEEEKVLEKTGFVFEVYRITWKHPAHDHDHYELFYLLNGESTQLIDNYMYTVEKGDFILIPKNVIHETSVNGTRMLIQVSEKFLNKYFTPDARDILLRVFHHPHLRPKKEDHDKILNLMNAIKEMYLQNDEHLFILFSQLMHYLSAAPTLSRVETAITERIKAVCQYVNVHYAEIKGIGDTAKKFYVSKSYLCRIFKKITGISFLQYLTKIKLGNAARLLVTENESVTKVAVACGFDSLAYFSNVFKKEYGVSPHRYKQGFPLK